MNLNSVITTYFFEFVHSPISRTTQHLLPKISVEMSDTESTENDPKHKKGKSKSLKPVSEDARTVVNENSKVLKLFKQYALELDKKHDRYERIVKLSRDLTIESKRIIFLLHSIDRGRELESVITEAKQRLDNLVKDCLCKIAKELKSEDPFMFHRGFSFGLQEFIEAYTFYDYIKDKSVNHWDHYQDMLKYNLSDSEGIISEIKTALVPTDYILGIADLSGELMRKCVNNLGAGEIDGCFETCEIVKKLYAGFLSIGSYKTKEMTDKTFTLKQNLLKMEKVCYNIIVRSRELPEHMLVHYFNEYDDQRKDS